MRCNSMRFSRSLAATLITLAVSCGGGRIFTAGEETATNVVLDAGVPEVQAPEAAADAAVDPCLPNPCANGGTCTLEPGRETQQAVCACATGFTGPRCETNIDDCTPNPCLNGGTCVDGVASYTCNCAPGFSGPTCATNVDECTPNPCTNGGTCTDGTASFTCNCLPGFTGLTCATNIDDCTPAACQNGGTCVDGVASFTCNCLPGFSGLTCGTNIDECTPNPCLHGGTCTDGVNSFTCACNSGRWTGPTCAVDRCVSGIVAEVSSGQSCSGLPATCGSNGNESCCRSPLVLGNATGSRCEGTTFYRDYDDAPDQFNTQTYPAQVSDFYFNRFDVTVGRFKAFVNAYDAWIAAGNPVAGAGAHPKIPGSGWDPSWTLPADAATFRTNLNTGSGVQTWDAVTTNNDRRPIDTEDWYEAFAFCLWDGGRLATEAEWTYAQMGGSEQRAYPWSVPASDLAITASHASWGCTGNGVAGCQNSDIMNVGSFPLGDGRWGHADLVGNVWKWGFDLIGNPPPSNNPGNLCTNCARVSGGATRIIRGGWHGAPADQLRPAGRGFQQAISRSGHSLRCVYDLP